MYKPKYLLDKIREAQEQQLKVLNLSSSLLETVPESISNLTNLTTLNLSSNFL
ncbi:MAG: hypothetical protein AAGA80_15095, partial [Cyanobacteria bacterium P01_F01_bin.143]